ncbi:hypothetical protein SCOCK_60049 [Actinacidiphila cocklensis]|uniref:Uncharacterized protein n=1 Tax=Actinacidiphila cocklensis TaxID=887465 RepID=A0A9W4E1H6_9ACTN|nr:hypothetical protein SCOCK_60049 [Actinacidiphila cocklensis]
MGRQPQLHPPAPDPGEPGADRLRGLQDPAGHRQRGRRHPEALPPAVRRDQLHAPGRRVQVRPDAGHLGRRLAGLERRERGRDRRGQRAAAERPGHPDARVARQHAGRDPADRAEPREPRHVLRHDLPADRPGGGPRRGRRHHRQHHDGRHDREHHQRRHDRRWRRELHRQRDGRGPVERPVQPQRLGLRLQQLDRDGEHARPRGGHVDLEHQRQLPQPVPAGRQAQRQRQQLGPDSTEERLDHLAVLLLQRELERPRTTGAAVPRAAAPACGDPSNAESHVTRRPVTSPRSATSEGCTRRRRQSIAADQGASHGRASEPLHQHHRPEVHQVPQLGGQGGRRLVAAPGHPGPGAAAGQPDQRLRLLHRHAHQGRRGGGGDRPAPAPGRRLEGGHRLHRRRAGRPGADRGGHPYRGRGRRGPGRGVGERRQAPRRGRARRPGGPDRGDQRLQQDERHHQAARGLLPAGPVRLIPLRPRLSLPARKFSPGCRCRLPAVAVLLHRRHDPGRTRTG